MSIGAMRRSLARRVAAFTSPTSRRLSNASAKARINSAKSRINSAIGFAIPAIKSRTT